MILAINIGSTSIKLALDRGEDEPYAASLPLNPDDNRELYHQDRFNLLVERLKGPIHDFLDQNNTDPKKLVLVISRGGLQKPGPAGIFLINREMCSDLSGGNYGYHPSSLGPVLAFTLAEEYQISAYAIDPPSTDEFSGLARFSGIPELERKSAFHALSHKAAGRKAAALLGKRYKECNLIVAHLGGGITIGAHLKGQVVDCTHGLNEGPFTPERAGSLPVLDACSLFLKHNLEEDGIKQMLVGKSGLMAYLGTKSGIEVEEKIKRGDRQAETVFQAMLYQVAKDIGAMAAVLKGICDGVVLTGALTRSERLVDILQPGISFIGPIFVFPEDIEMHALLERGREIIAGQESIIYYL